MTSAERNARIGRPVFAIPTATLFVVALSGCPSEPNRPTVSSTSSTPVVASLPARDTGEAHRCNEDAECQITCAQGAVNRRWYEANERKLKHCKDGCMGWGETQAKCIDGRCVAWLNGKRDDACTNQPVGWVDD